MAMNLVLFISEKNILKNIVAELTWQRTISDNENTIKLEVSKESSFVY